MMDVDQLRVVEAVRGGKNVFFTGPAGTGKSHVIRAISGTNPNIVLTALTGVAASNIGGKTLHSFAGVKLARESKHELRANAMKSSITTERWRRCKMLIVDEVSMMSSELLEKVDWVGRGCRNRLNEPFGGIQVVFVGDFLQLPPVPNKNAEVEFCFDSPIWKELAFECVMLRTNYRQTDPVLVKGLAAMRLGVLEDDFLKAISATKTREGLIRPTSLVSTNRVADQINTDQLNALEGEHVYYKAEEAEYERGALENLQGSSEITLAVGAQVMHIMNKDPLVNGSRGVVTGFRDTMPIVLFHGLDAPIVVELHLFEHKIRNQLIAYRKCVPLRLAWAVTIHKSQSLTIDLLDVDCDRMFAASQAYVAVSRARNVEGLFVKNLHKGSVWVDPRVEEFYKSFTA